MNGMNQSSAVPHWPALYDPFLELRNIAHRNDTQPGASYLYDPNGEPFRYYFLLSAPRLTQSMLC